ncbi:hypothetical protein Tco_0666263 [Tanacetum coccineum]
MLSLTVPSPVATPTIAESEGFLTGYDRDIGELFTRSGAVRDEIFSQRYRFRSLEYEQERVAVTFGAIWRPVLALESWAGENRDLRLQLAEERRVRFRVDVVVGQYEERAGASGGAYGFEFESAVLPACEDPYEAIMQAYLDGTDAESKPFKDPVETETPEIVRMVVRVPPATSSGLSASMAEVAAMSDFVFSKRFRSSYESLPSLSPPYLPSRKRYRGTSKLVKDSEEDDDEEDEESFDSNSVSEDAEDEGPTAEDEDLAAGDEGLAAGVEGLGTDDESHGLDDESHGRGERTWVSKGTQFVDKLMTAALDSGYGALEAEVSLE